MTRFLSIGLINLTNRSYKSDINVQFISINRTILTTKRLNVVTKHSEINSHSDKNPNRNNFQTFKSSIVTLRYWILLPKKILWPESKIKRSATKEGLPSDTPAIRVVPKLIFILISYLFFTYLIPFY